ncbi:MAG: RecQ family ATP-dependent DNA helicase [Chitinophagaceae bacterium]|nr:MAG: RecQ family ATP-dependent DNA helicase [Chitinophagaceae bacterium]
MIAFIDLEADPRTGKISDIGAQRSDGSSLHSGSIPELLDFTRNCSFLCGHNIVRHDLQLIGKAVGNQAWGLDKAIDTLLYSPLLFPARPYHRLVKDTKLLPEESNDPLEDARKAQHLLESEIAAFAGLDQQLQNIYFCLVGTQPGFAAFFRYIHFGATPGFNCQAEIQAAFAGRICKEAPIASWIAQNPVALAYALALVSATDRYSITPPWVVHSYPKVETIMRGLRNMPCANCPYCRAALDPVAALQRFFGYTAYRNFDGVPLQERAVGAAIRHKSLLAIFPTGGGKSITFQVPALLSGEAARALTIVISPLQSLMKDQVDNLELKGITDAVTINGLLDPVERQIAIERVQGTSKEHSVAHVLYLSPESLRSLTIKRLLLGRKIARIVIDEAHCFSAWGQDFRVDYLYIGDFIRELQLEKELEEAIPVSCFTATAKPQVVEDIREYFRNKLGLELDLFQAGTSRDNLHYSVVERDSDEAKYAEVRRLLEAKLCPSIVYVSRTRRAAKVAERLNNDGFRALAYHGKMEKEERVANQNAFLQGDIDIMVATSAFGMGVDKEDVGQVIHYDISDSLENYVQEAGRAGRSENILADCHILFDEADLDKHFLMLNQTKLDVKEINQVWRAIRSLEARKGRGIHSSALEIARKAGWDDTVAEIETRVKTAIAALEDAGFVRRGHNMPRVFANSILSPNAQVALEQIKRSALLNDADKVKAGRIVKKLFSSKSKRLATDEDAESRVDYISDHLAIVRDEVIRIIEVLRKEKILADTKDLTAFIKRSARVNRSLAIVEQYRALELFLARRVAPGAQIVNLKEWSEAAEGAGLTEATPVRIRTLLNFWAVKNWIRKRPRLLSHHHIDVELLAEKEVWLRQIERRHHFASAATVYLFDKMQRLRTGDEQDEVLVEFSLVEMTDALATSAGLFGGPPDLAEIEDTLFFLSRIEAIKIEGGFLVIYNRLTLERLQHNNAVRYTNADYRKLADHYKSKVEQIHIVGAFARRMIDDYEAALRFVDDYFTLEHTVFMAKHFPGKEAREELARTMTKARFEKLFGALSAAQLRIIRDHDHPRIVVAAGPGSGKTRVLVHKMASILLTEDVKKEQMLMLTFSRSAATEFKSRLLALIGNAAHRVEIRTFHSYAFDLLGRSGTLDKSEQVLTQALDRIAAGEVENNRVTKSVLLVDEAQDMNAQEFALVDALVQRNEDIRVLLVGDDDQNIFEFRKADVKYLRAFMESGAYKHELNHNYRSSSEIVDFSNAWAETLPNRLKEFPMVAVDERQGSVCIVEHASGNLAMPVADEVQRIMQSGESLAVLTFTNEEAGQVAALLAHRGIPARLVQQQKDFRLGHLRELRLFSDKVLNGEGSIILDDVWVAARSSLEAAFAQSDKLAQCLRVIDAFAAVNGLRKYKSDWNTFLYESRWEDFAFEGGAPIIISTMHKAKGREFDSVIVLLHHFKEADDACRRLLYVAATRARRTLVIHTDTAFVHRFTLPGLSYLRDTAAYPEPKQLRLELRHADINLGYFPFVQQRVAALRPGDPITLLPDGLGNREGQRVLQYSKSHMLPRLAALEKQGYLPAKAWVEFIVWWKDKEGQEHQIVLAGLELEKH